MADIDIADVIVGTVDSGDDLLGVARPSNLARLFSVANIITLAQTFVSSIVGVMGSNSAPSYTFAGDTNTGVYSPATDQVSIALNGAERVNFQHDAGGSTETTLTLKAGSGQGMFIGSNGGTRIQFSNSTATITPSRFAANCQNGGGEILVGERTNGVARSTSLWLYDEDNGTLEQVTVGNADSGGTGFKVLRIPN